MAFEILYTQMGDTEPSHHQKLEAGQITFYPDASPRQPKLFGVAQMNPEKGVKVFRAVNPPKLDGNTVIELRELFSRNNFLGEIPPGCYAELTYRPSPDEVGKLVICTLIDPNTPKELLN